MRGATIVLLSSLAACGRSVAPGDPSHPRIVSLHDVTTEMMVAIGAVGHLVGVADPVEVPPETERALAVVPRVASLESILPLRPDVVLGLGVIARQDPELVERLRERGIEVVLAEPATLDDVYALTRKVAQRAGVAEAGAELADRIRARVDAIGPVPPGAATRVFVYDCCDPPFTAGGRTVLGDLIARAGGRNVFADLDAEWTHVSWEEVVARRPELVVVHSYAEEGQGDVGAKLARLHAVPSLAAVPTLVLPLGLSLGGLRSADGLERLRQAMGHGS